MDGMDAMSTGPLMVTMMAVGRPERP